MTAPPDTLPAPPETEIHCPLCAYNLRGLIEPRCPECGYRAESWEELGRLARELHPFLYEHHPQHPYRSRVRTLVAGLNTWRFWASVKPPHAIKVRRLVRYWLLWATLVACPLIVLYAQVAVNVYFTYARERTSSAAMMEAPTYPRHREEVIRLYGSIQAALDAWYPLPPSPRFFLRPLLESPALGVLLPLGALLLAWPFLIVITMLMFAITLRRARIRPAQLFRCAVYSWDAAVPFVLLLLAAVFWMLLEPLPATVPLWRRPWHQWHRTIAIGSLWGGAVLALLLVLRLGVAFSRYLGLRHAFMTALLVQVVIVLCGVKIAYMIWGY